MDELFEVVNYLKPSLKIKIEKSYHSNFAMLCVFCAPIMLWVRGEEIREATYIYGGALLSGECLSFWSLYRLDAQQGKGEGGGWGCTACFLKLLTYL